jgi:replicative DNA helicase
MGLAALALREAAGKGWRMEERVVPHDEGIERACLGGMLMPWASLGVLEDCRRLGIRGECWYLPGARTVAETVLKMAEGGRQVDALVVGAALTAAGKLDEVGGQSWLDGCVDLVVTEQHVRSYLMELRQLFIRREIIRAARELEVDAYQNQAGDGLLAQAPDRFLEIMGKVQHETSNDLVMGESLERWERARRWKQEGDESCRPAIGVDTPWKDLTEMICGWEPGVTVIGGRPSAGKTTFEDAVAVHAARAGVGVGRATLDATRRELLERSLCREAGCSLPKLKFGFGRKDQLALAQEAREELAKLPLFFQEGVFELREICTWARFLKARKGIGMLTIDYVQQVQASELRNAHDSVARVGHVMRGLKGLALELQIPVLVLAQLNRAVEKESRTPNMADLKDSGVIEESAHKILFLFRDVEKVKGMEERAPGATKHKRPVWCYVAKQKDGRADEGIPMWLLPAYFRFERSGSNDWSDDALPDESRKDVASGEAGRAGYLPEWAQEGGDGGEEDG